MPRSRRRRPQSRSALGDPELAHYLRTGEESFDFVLFGASSGEVHSLSSGMDALEKLQEAWAVAREELVAAAIAERPGTRPWAWWLFDAPRADRVVAAVLRAGARGWHPPAPRRQVGGSGAPAWPDATNFGLSPVWRDIDLERPPVVESGPAYLLRHRLLGRDERARVPAAAIAPVVLGRDLFDEAPPDAWALWPSWSSRVYRGSFEEILADLQPTEAAQ